MFVLPGVQPERVRGAAHGLQEHQLLGQMLRSRCESACRNHSRKSSHARPERANCRATFSHVFAQVCNHKNACQCEPGWMAPDCTTRDGHLPQVTSKSGRMHAARMNASRRSSCVLRFCRGGRRCGGDAGAPWNRRGRAGAPLETAEDPDVRPKHLQLRRDATLISVSVCLTARKLGCRGQQWANPAPARTQRHLLFNSCHLRR